jgi:hypothetical protein
VSSGAANSTPFTEQRYEGGAGYSYVLDDYTFGGDFKFSTESDYDSVFLGLHGKVDLAQKNTTLGLGIGGSYDLVSAAAAQGPVMLTLRCSAGNPAERDCPLYTFLLYGSASQIVSPNAVIGVSVDVSALHGYQSNPYRQAIAGQNLVPERHPTGRLREAFTASGRYYITRTGTTLIGAYRYYRDDWAVHAHTPELRIVQEAGREVDASLRYRYYTQDGAYFYRTRYPTDDPTMRSFVSDDVKLSSFTGHTFEAKLGVLGDAFHLDGRWAGARFEGILEYAVQNNRFGNAIIAHVALTLPFVY